MNVLSLFDGISCAQIALKRLEIKIDNYFASEIDKNAIKVTQYNYPGTIQLGDVQQIRGSDLPKIDLLIGGSPCQGFSICGKMLNFDDPRSKLFFEYVRLLRECQPKYFLLENVKMKKEWRDIISEYLKVEPILINSALVSAQNRERLYWTNILNIKPPENKNFVVRDIIDIEGNYEYYYDWETVSRKYGKGVVHFDWLVPMNIYQFQRASYLNKKHTTLTSSFTIGSNILCEDNRIRKTTPIERERLQTIPDNYTSMISKSKRYKVLGNCFTVDVIVHILKAMDSLIESGIYNLRERLPDEPFGEY